MAGVEVDRLISGRPADSNRELCGMTARRMEKLPPAGNHRAGHHRSAGLVFVGLEPPPLGHRLLEFLAQEREEPVGLVQSPPGGGVGTHESGALGGTGCTCPRSGSDRLM